MRSLLTAIFLVGLGAATSWSTSAQGGERGNIQLLPPAQVSSTGAVSTNVVPVRVGVGWRGLGYYPGFGRPYYGGGFRGGYYGGYGPYGNYGYQPYYNAYRPYYGYGYRYW